MTEGHMHARVKLRRYQVLAERSQVMATAAHQMIDELLHLAETQQSVQLVALTEVYRAAIDDVRHGVRVGANLPPLLFKLESIGREVAAHLLSLQRNLIAETAAAPLDGSHPNNDSGGDHAALAARKS